MEYHDISMKLAFASFEARLLDSGFDPQFLKTAAMAGEIVSKDLIGSKTWSQNILEALKRIKNNAIRGTVASKETVAPGIFHNKKYISNFVTQANLQSDRAEKLRRIALRAKRLRKKRALINKLKKSPSGVFRRDPMQRAMQAEKTLARQAKMVSKARKATQVVTPGIMKRLGTSALRGMNRAFALEGAYNIGSNLLSKRKKNVGFFESAGRRLGNVTRTLAFNASGGPLSAVGTADMVSDMLGGPTVSKVTSTIGKGVDTGIRKARAAGIAVRKVFGGGSTLEAKNRLAMMKRPKLKTPNKKLFELKAGYQ
jgi:hypothetical protein